MWGDNGADSLDAAVKIIVAGVAKAGDCDAAETTLHVRRVGQARRESAAHTVRIERCDSQRGLSSAQVDLVRQALARCTVAEPVDLVVTFDAS